MGVFLWHAWVFATLEIDKSCYLSQEKLLGFVYVSWMFGRDFWDDMRYNLVFFISHCQTWSFTMLSSSSRNSSTLSTSPILDSASYHIGGESSSNLDERIQWLCGGKELG